MATKQFMTLDNLTTYDGLIKQYIGAEDAKSIKAVALDGTSLKFYDVESPTSQTQQKYTINLPSAEGFMPLIDNATGDKVVTSNSDGSVSESDWGIGAFGSRTGLVTGYLNGNETGYILVSVGEDYDIGDSRVKIDDLVTGGGSEGYLAVWNSGSELGNEGITVSAVDSVIGATNGFDGDNTIAGFIGTIPQGSSATTIVGYVDEVAGSITTASDVTLVEAQTPTTGYLKTYELYQGGNAAANLVGKIDIPKDLVVTSGEIVVNPTGQPAGTYLKLTIANQTAPVYINVADLCDAYTAASGATQVQLAISNTNEISATLVAGGVGTTELANNAVTTAKINNGAVTTDKIANNAVTAAKIDISNHTETGDNATGDESPGIQVSVTTQDGQVSGVSVSTTGYLYNVVKDQVLSDIDSAIRGLDATVSKSAGNDGLALQVVEEDGVLTSVTGSIAANTYDAYGAASTAESNANTYTDNATAAISTASIEALFE